MNTSATGGYLQAAAPGPLEDDSLEDLFQGTLVGITGIPGALIRPRWQPEPPNLPDYGTSWVAFGISGTKPATYGYEEFIVNDAHPDGLYAIERTEEVDMLCSFYGPQATRNAALVRDGLSLGQNLYALQEQGVTLVQSAGLIVTAELIKERWLPRADMTVTLRRRTRREYPVLSIVAADVEVYTDPPLTGPGNAGVYVLTASNGVIRTRSGGPVLLRGNYGVSS